MKLLNTSIRVSCKAIPPRRGIDQEPIQNKSIVSTIVHSSLLFLLGFGFLFFSSCSPKIILPTIATIQPLQEMQRHYAVLAAFDAAPVTARKEMDAIKFPSKFYEEIANTIQPAYLSRTELTAMWKTVQPPANSSEQTRKELDFLLDLQKIRTPEQEEEVIRMHYIGYIPLPGMNDEQDLFFEAFEVFGADFSIAKYPNTKKLLNNLMKEMRIMEFDAKNHIMRARPRQLESKLQPLTKMNSSSFASGHTLWAYIQAYTFAELTPSNRNAFLDLAFKIGFSRELLGVHYPSDEEAARKLAHQMLAKMWKKSDFKKDFHAAKLEWE